ncbi:MAG: hypothetical protein COX57_05845 [Alphaproteobacteria bacterium CG_4_10_14_0_2_um_filter_63_37]|nr:MAG: hypothetical protein COX57_05845 [Alphaproteobacteria bacterium CG_4_10_14_0_2_um_filter_63_37]
MELRTAYLALTTAGRNDAVTMISRDAKRAGLGRGNDAGVSKTYIRHALLGIRAAPVSEDLAEVICSHFRRHNQLNMSVEDVRRNFGFTGGENAKRGEGQQHKQSDTDHMRQGS